MEIAQHVQWMSQLVAMGIPPEVISWRHMEYPFVLQAAAWTEGLSGGNGHRWKAHITPNAASALTQVRIQLPFPLLQGYCFYLLSKP